MTKPSTPALTAKELALYLGCDIMVPDEKGPCIMEAVNKQGQVWIDSGCDYQCSEIKPILRRLESMTEEEAWECWLLAKHTDRLRGVTNPKCAIIDHTFYAQLPLDGWMPMVQCLLSKSFDLFGWIDSGLALEVVEEVLGTLIERTSLLVVLPIRPGGDR